MFWRGEARAGEARWGRASMRYMRMKPRIRERPIQAWGVRLWVSGKGDEVGRLEASVSSIEILPGSVGVLGGSEKVESAVADSGITGPGRASMACAAGLGVSSMRSRRLVSH